MVAVKFFIRSTGWAGWYGLRCPARPWHPDRVRPPGPLVRSGAGGGVDTRVNAHHSHGRLRGVEEEEEEGGGRGKEEEEGKGGGAKSVIW